MWHRAVAAALVIAALAVSSPAFAHHSFAVFFQTSRSISVTGVVTAIEFSNPHGLIHLTVTKPDGTLETWTAETNSPSILVRRGWSKNTLKIGERVTLKGWPARDGARYLRMQNAYRADGRMIGKPFDPNAD
ncbi:MAG TPA: DUF6152 family protein [Steroidobacteraceae bacterium]|nr:DUF6152 family protein [Steroidobacteraceae bacterium]